MRSRFAAFVPAALLGAGVVLISGIREQYSMSPRRPVASIAVSADEPGAHLVVIDSAERAVAGMSDYMLRMVGPDSAYQYSLYVGYYDKQVQGKSIHSPKNCLPGAGWEILRSERVPVAGVEHAVINRVMLANRGTQALVYYWYQGRGRLEASEYRVKWDLMRDAALYGRTEEALVRIVVPIEGSTDATTARAREAKADAVAQRLLHELVPAVDAVLPEPAGRAARRVASSR